MATGFVQRFKGKVTFDAGALWLAGQPLYGPGSAQSIGSVAAQSTTTLTGGGISSILASTQPIFARLPAPTIVGIEKTIVFTVGSSGAWVTLPAGVTFSGSTFNTIKTVTNGAASLVGVSSIVWAITGFASTGTLTFSTST